MKVPEDKTVLTRVGLGCKKAVWGPYRAGVDCGFGYIREGCNCSGHVAIWEKRLCEMFPSCVPKNKPSRKLCVGFLSAFPSEI